MNRHIFSLFFLVFVFVPCIGFAQGADSEGGNITPVNLTFEQNAYQWYVFWGNENNSTSNSVFSISNITISNISNSTRLLSFPPTYEYYVISDVSNPFSSSNYSSISFSQLDSHFGLSTDESSSYVFDSTSSFRVYSNSQGNYTDILLPTVYFPGNYSNGTSYAHAFKQGAAKIDSNPVFLVPKSEYSGIDGADIDYQFALPYSESSSNTFYLFSVSDQNAPPPAQIPPPAIQSGSGTPTASLSWEYDGVSLTVITESYADVIARDQLGSSYSGKASSYGKFNFRAVAGFKYYLSVSKEGFNPSYTTLYIPTPTILTGEKMNDTSGAQTSDIFLIENPFSGTIICIGLDCYAPESGSILDSAELLSELSCTGSICRFVGTTQVEFVQKYKLKKIPITFTAPRPGSPSVFDLSHFMQTLSLQVSSALGDQPAIVQRERNLFLYAFTFFAILAVVISSMHITGRKKVIGGYG